MIPSRRLVLLYIGTAHVSLALAFALVGWDPLAVAGFFYHSRMVAIVHLVTIGWIGLSILGNIYVVLPMAFGRPLPARRGDYAAYALVVIGLIGMVAHFWLAEFSGMAWSAATAAAGVAHVVVRAALALRASRVPGGVKAHIFLASANILGAITMGVLLGFDKVHQFLPGYVLSNVFAHAHLAAVGWASMMVIGMGYRMLPMLLPAAAPDGNTIYISALLLEVGVVGLFVSLVVRLSLTGLFALLIVAGFAAAGAHVIWMIRHPRTPTRRPGTRFAIAHVATAAAWLVLACVFGVLLALTPTNESTLRAAMVYGVFGLVGFLAQVIVGFEGHALPTTATYWALNAEGASAIGSLRAADDRLRATIYVAWLCGVPALAAGLFFTEPIALASGAWILFVAVVLGIADILLVVRRTALV